MPVQQGVVAVIRRAARFLVIRRAAAVRAPGQFCFPGGGLESGETEAQALCREMREELGCEVQPLRALWRSVTPWEVSLAWWLVELPASAQLLPNPAEVESVLWLTGEELEQLPELLPSNRHFLDAWQRGEFTLE